MTPNTLSPRLCVAQAVAAFTPTQQRTLVAAFTLARADAVSLYRESCRLLQGIYVRTPPPPPALACAERCTPQLLPSALSP